MSTVMSVLCSWRRLVASVGAICVAMVLYLIANLSMLLIRSDWSWGAFRSYSAHDQLSYLAYTVNVAQGRMAASEPFTETGSSYYPRDYYVGLGIIARTFGITGAEAWSIVGIIVQLVLVAAVALSCILVTGHAWTGVLGVGPFLLGVMAVATGSPEFYRLMDSHAVLWGPYAVLFPLNGEAFGLCVGGIAMLLLLLAAIRISSRRARLAVALAASVAVGSLANVQTYSFLTLAYLIVYVVAAYGLVSGKRRWPAILSITLLPVLFLSGPLVSANSSQLITLMFGLLPALPGLASVIVRSRGIVAVCGVLAVAAASPSILGTILGLHDKDPFLLYRVASSKNLGVEPLPGLIGSLVLAVPLILLVVAGIHRKRVLWVAYPIGVTVAWGVLSTNDLWGANQEPYRFWIDSFMLIAVTMLPLLLAAAQEYLFPRGVIADVGLPLRSTSREPARAQPPSRRDRGVAAVALAVVSVLILVSMLDFVKFYRTNHSAPMIALQGPRIDAIRHATDAVRSGLILPDACIEPRVLKAVTAKPVAFLNLGMAWPEKYKAVIAVNSARDAGKFALDSAQKAGVEWLLTDSTCGFDWASTYSGSLTLVSSADYESGSIELWRIHY